MSGEVQLLVPHLCCLLGQWFSDWLKRLPSSSAFICVSGFLNKTWVEQRIELLEKMFAITSLNWRFVEDYLRTISDNL